MQIDLDKSRTKLVIDLQQKYVGKHTCNSLFITKSAAHYKEFFFQIVIFTCYYLFGIKNPQSKYKTSTWTSKYKTKNGIDN